MGTSERREREKASRRTAILDAAENVFLDGGVAHATMDDVARRAELSKGALYLYFTNKDELFVAIALRAVRALHAHITAFPLDADTGLGQLRQLLERHVAFADQHARRFQVAASWLTSGFETVAAGEQFTEYRRTVGELAKLGDTAIERGKQDGSIRRDLPTPTITLQLWASLMGVLLVRTRGPETQRRFTQRLDLAGLGRAHIDVILRGLAAAPAALESAWTPEVADKESS